MSLVEKTYLGLAIFGMASFIVALLFISIEDAIKAKRH